MLAYVENVDYFICEYICEKQSHVLSTRVKHQQFSRKSIVNRPVPAVDSVYYRNFKIGYES
jgi:hypothetical protein